MKRVPKSDKNGVWQKLLDVLYENMRKLVPNEKLIEVSGQHNYARRIRELRAEGWDIRYSSSPSGYTLKSVNKKGVQTDGYINLKLRLKVLERDRYVCQLCGHKGGEKYDDGHVVNLEVDHITPLRQQGKTVEENLWTLCSRCNAGKKSLAAYPETIKNKIVSVNLPDDLRLLVSEKSLKTGRSVNSLLLDAIRIGAKEF
ncbi:MAG: HNH endonuclease [Microgenomates group bacterium Gr01-1014_16]|nr:MAG: HNH endonuclease [Microgenomates group bacterium Gr01-1014_16]